MLIYDCEIIKAIPPKDGIRIEGVTYCDGWHDLENMGISVIGAYDTNELEYHIYLEDNFDEFVKRAKRCGVVAGFNNYKFDDQLLRANGIELGVESADLLVQIWEAHGLAPVFQYPTHIGYSLDNCAEANRISMKTGNGALAPVLWQRGRYGQVIDYCLQDVRITKELIDLVSDNTFRSPKTREPVEVEWPWEIPF